MNTNKKIYFHKQNLPLSLIPFILLFGLVTFGVLAILGLFIGIVVGVVAIGLILFRFLTPSGKKEAKRVEDQGRTIVLREDEYDVIEGNRRKD